MTHSKQLVMLVPCVYVHSAIGSPLKTCILLNFQCQDIRENPREGILLFPTTSSLASVPSV